MVCLYVILKNCNVNAESKDLKFLNLSYTISFAYVGSQQLLFRTLLVLYLNRH